MTTLALIGFGEAGQAMASGLRDEPGCSGLASYDVRFADPDAGPPLLRIAEENGVRAAKSIAECVAGADIVLSLVVGSVAVKVGEEAGHALGAGQIFVDLNSISPDAKQDVADAIAKHSPAGFVEGAVMARVPPLKHKVPILLAGERAERAAELLAQAGMDVEVAGDRIGQACAVKMIRSVLVKGVEALLLESLTAAERAGVRERILDSISGTFPGLDWRETATYYLGRTQQHGARRVTEMKEAAATVRGLGLDPVMSRAIAETIADAHGRFAASGLAYGKAYPELLEALAGTERKEPSE
jgi:3-hydroxyisobutyrate dehydrogenase-like beta-hydroxyacid dehydrogenase